MSETGPEFPAVVMDASAFLALVLSEDRGPEVEAVLTDIISRNGQVLVPPLFWYEVMNGLVTAVRRERISAADLRAIETDMHRLPLSPDQVPSEFIRQRIRELALEHHLAFYDASYLELALRYTVPLLTMDGHLLDLREEYPELILTSGSPV